MRQNTAPDKTTTAPGINHQGIGSGGAKLPPPAYGIDFLDQHNASAQPPTPTLHPSNNTGLPDTLKAGVENLSRLSMDDVRVHYNSTAPGEVGALAYARGTDIHLAPGQEQHLPHEAWHVVQQKQGRVAQTARFHGKPGNDDAALEREAQQQGRKAASFVSQPQSTAPAPLREGAIQQVMLQRVKGVLKRIGDKKWQIVDSTDETKLYHIANSALLEMLWIKHQGFEGETREFKADSPQKGKAMITYTEEDKALNENQNPQTSPSDLVKNMFDTLEGDRETISSNYPLIAMCEGLILNDDGWDFGSMLPYCALLHFNAEKIFSIFQSLPVGQHLDHLYALQTYVTDVWKMGGTLYEKPDQYVGKPQALKIYLQTGLESCMNILSELGADAQLDFIRDVIDSQKGYSWFIPDIEKWRLLQLEQQPQTVRTADQILQTYLQDKINMNPFTGKSSEGVPSLGRLLATDYKTYDADTKAIVWGNFFTTLKKGAKIRRPDLLRTYLESQYNNIVSALKKYVSTQEAQEIADECLNEIKGYEEWFKDSRNKNSNENSNT